MKVRIDFQTGAERVFFGLYEHNNDFVVTYTSTEFGSCNPGGSYSLHFSLTRTKMTNSETTKSGHEVWRIRRCNAGTLNSLMAKGQPLLLRMRKIGRSYISSIMLQGSEQPQWIDLPGLNLRQAKGKFAFGVYQGKKAEGETSLSVDWVKLESR